MIHQNESSNIFAPVNPDPLIFIDDRLDQDIPENAWKIMLVDDDRSVHQATKVALKFFTFEDKPLQFLSAYSGQEAKALIQAHPDTALILLDVIMESPNAGLMVAKHIREVLENTIVRIVLRTGQPGQVPEDSVVVEYDINDYKTKLELTQQKLFTTLVASLRSYRDLLALQQSQNQLARLNFELQTFNQNLEQLVSERTQALEAKNVQLLHEIDERQKAEESLRVYIHALTHDLRNPVTGMTNVLNSLLQRPLVEGGAAVEIPVSVLQRMAAGCDRQLKMIELLVEAHEIDVWGIALQNATFSLTEMLQALVTDWKPSLAKKRMMVESQLAPERIIVNGDRDQIWRVFENLLGNAYKFNPPGISITISVSPLQSDPTFVRCTVHDTGVGIAPAQIADLFELYQRGTAVQNNTKGLGIGLYICRRIIEAHGGQIGVTSQLNQGSKFWFTLPTVQGHPL